ncbi:MAG: pyrroline-5-carboxylate reductase [Hydrogenophilales bacterium CG17_big_fil_post_rev_8_21_14_2_50_63_12]|nr:MAG: pyrroline-5-carboxylate reductase [Hydrogenophilales bacterium CG17_big_fil_post_rev_8_21_14_2_50_63_12]PIX95735.1 MAG: pyrroline-5-carboxylate reductase [Hydrogenophilales bacterium CG_4_10_14_3_um_filter_63_21]PJB04353.1 MAG: pyrroline-5-carboxylate reductase [Hydrogenophilales bacterium CG_4_9_14_3_um_filter_63_34]
MKLGFIGGGNMAAAMVGGLVQKGFAREDIIVAEQQPERRTWLAQEFTVNVVDNAAEVLAAEAVVLAVKPQQLHAALRSLPPLRPELLVVSIAAGVRASDISRWLHGHPSVVRAMPNTPALVGAGVTGLYALPAVSEAQRTQATQLLEAVGSVVWVDTEAQIDAVTAISGSGPAYVFLFIEALEQAAIDLGLPAETARQLTLHTFLGASALAIKDKSTPAELRARVTSKGGTTERGLMALEEGGVKYAIGLAARAAAERAQEMGVLFGKD